jgi:hypothetical protein
MCLLVLMVVPLRTVLLPGFVSCFMPPLLFIIVAGFTGCPQSLRQLLLFTIFLRSVQLSRLLHQENSSARLLYKNEQQQLTRIPQNPKTFIVSCDFD